MQQAPNKTKQQPAPVVTVFNPQGLRHPTFQDALAPAMQIQDAADAQQYLRAYIAHIECRLADDQGVDGHTAEQIARANLGYFAGYYDHTTRERVERLFGAVHPVIGSASKGECTPAQALEAGAVAARGAACR